jgi:hypothetical protein
MKKYLLVGVVLVAALWYVASVVMAEEAKNAYIGDNAKKCAMCHKDQVAAWQNWSMAKAWDKLSEEDKKKEECIKCHVTGYGQEGGWVSFEKTPQLVGIQCEACHGPMTAHMAVPMADKEARKASTVAPTAATCQVCHIKEGNPHFKEFKYEEAVKALADHLKKEG